MRRVTVVYLWALAFLVGLVDAPAASSDPSQPPPQEVHLINTARVTIRFTIFDADGHSHDFTIRPAEELSFRNADTIRICTKGHPCEEAPVSLGGRYEIRRHPQKKVWYVTESSQ
jgi:hypothetical protein